MSTHKDELIKLLIERSYQRRRITLVSGRESDFYIDGKQTTLHARGAWLIGHILLELLGDGPEVVAVGGMSMGADPIATAASVASVDSDGPVLHAFLVRKEAKGHGTSASVEGLGNIPAGSPVCVVEDTTTTGGSLLRAVERVRAAGLKVVRTVTVVDREEGAAEKLAEHGLVLEALVLRTEIEARSLGADA